MRVAFIAPWSVNIPNGGIKRVQALAAIVADLGHDVHLFYPGVSEGSRAEAQSHVMLHAVDSTGRGQGDLARSVRPLKRVVLPLPTVAGARNKAIVDRVAMEGPWDVLSCQYPAAPQFEGIASALWVDFHDVHTRYALREARVGPAYARVGSLVQSALCWRDEVALARRAELVTAAGHRDRLWLEYLSGRGVSWLPTPVDVPLEIPEMRRAKTAGLIGDFHYTPNRDAAEHLFEAWLPALTETGYRVLLAGRGSGELVASARGVDALGVVGKVADFYSEISVALAPIRRGGGIKVKVGEAMAYGRPVLATQFALEGFRPDLPRSVVAVGSQLDRRTIDRVAEATAEAAEAGRTYARQHLSHSASGRVVKNTLTSLLST